MSENAGNKWRRLAVAKLRRAEVELDCWAKLNAAYNVVVADIKPVDGATATVLATRRRFVHDKLRELADEVATKRAELALLVTR